VTKGQYEAMMQEVARNKGCNINMSQTIIPPEASDSIMHGELKQIQSKLKRHVNTNNESPKIAPKMPKTSSQQQYYDMT
jgi:hypothetical protein